jgi:hypothetical protein
LVYGTYHDSIHYEFCQMATHRYLQVFHYPVAEQDDVAVTLYAMYRLPWSRVFSSLRSRTRRLYCH